LSGPDSLPDVAARIAEEARALRTIVSPQFSSEELSQLQALSSTRNDRPFSDFVNRARPSGERV
jgi:hypothetical protein